MSDGLEPMREDWQRLLATVAHPDDLEYGAASAIARWTGATYGLPGQDPILNQADHRVVGAGIESLEAHCAYLVGLGRDFDPSDFLRGMTVDPGRTLGVGHAVAFGRVQLAGV